jgi:hypothetical protein
MDKLSFKDLSQDSEESGDTLFSLEKTGVSVVEPVMFTICSQLLQFCPYLSSLKGRIRTKPFILAGETHVHNFLDVA